MRSYDKVVLNKEWYRRSKLSTPFRHGFTIVELLIVIVIIAVLAAIVIVAYNGIQNRAWDSALKTDLTSVKNQLLMAKETDGIFPNDINGLVVSSGTELSRYRFSDTLSTFCVTSTNSSLANKSYFITESTSAQEGKCPLDGDFIQTITTTTCLVMRTRSVDARDNHTYWVQKMKDGKCWMLTSLAYAGGGVNTYGDSKTILNGTSDTDMVYTDPKYYISSTANATTEPTLPSTSTPGAQYGYHYNWCAATGNQQSTNACSSTEATSANTAISICPAGWRLPTGGTSSEFQNLIIAIKGKVNGDSGPQATWLSQRSGSWYGSFVNAYTSGSVGNGMYWSSTQVSTTNAYALFTDAGSLTASFSINKNSGQAVRCIAN